jgi:hypothetical protein
MNRGQIIFFLVLSVMSYINIVVALDARRLASETYKTTNYVYGLLDLVNRNVLASGGRCHR